MHQNKLILRIFVDESGKFQFPDLQFRFYIVGIVLHDTLEDISSLEARLELDWLRMGLSDFCFHAGPLIRKEKGYQYMLREQRAAIFSRMMLFTRQVKFKHHCLVVDKKFVDSSQQIIEKLRRQLEVFLASSVFLPYGNHNIEIYYDCGQAPITGILRASFSSWFGERVEFVKDVKPERYKLFQLADMICSIKLIESKLAVGMPLTQNEIRLFGGSRKFKHNILRSIKMKEI